MVKLLCIDIDGTLLNSRKELPQENVTAIHAAMDQGVIIAIASGRSVSGMKPLLDQLGIGMHAVCLNGALIYYDKIVHQTVMDEELVLKVIERAEHYNSQIFLSAADFNITNGMISDSLRKLIQEGSLRSDYQYCNGFDEMRAEAHKHKDEILKIALKELDEEHYEDLKADLIEMDLFHVAKSDTYFVDVNLKGNNKGSGVRILAQHLGIPMEQVMCIGDNENDLEMIQAAGIGVAMGNGAETVKQAADYISSDNDHGGLAEAICRFILTSEA